ncbi:3-deoxy-7-phosphoheptulonate synthase [Sphingomonas sp. BN140010]|uniref:Phospho-2-dehydro-3-deoxyheptonate aldolase n=1 Tax=Sphingomonas arvum TaxID=2992113 RepID=A0ABT3JBN0_9SPHN|nr:3-deoxy-7-phosphoheptulonate synthase [Sphingomonas sp. BN140010]MCW3796226.1 3-deoxy-7-phosphoheptulonate synthase [Sphingomonas sp. BN140010]
MGEPWHPASWRDAQAAQQPVYADAGALAAVESELRTAAPLVRAEEVDLLAARLAEAAAGRALLLQGGDCAETFDRPDVAGLAALFERLAGTLEGAARVPVVRVARIAGQFAKPRTVEGQVWRGEIVNGREALEPDPARMLRAERHARTTLAELPAGLFASHEALLLPYEESLVRRTADGRWLGPAHLLWVGERTRQPDGAHVRFLSGLANPVAAKLGPAASVDDVLRLAERLDPAHEPGRLTFIVRHGAEAIGRSLPPLLRAARRTGLAALWVSDPMHGNTVRGGARKMRRLADMIAETEAFVATARAEGVWPGGLHLEMTPEPVAECVGGAEGTGWSSACDPRLNPEQAAELVGAFAAALSRRKAA